MIKNLGLQLYTVRDYFRDEEFTDLTFKKIAEAGYTEAHGAGSFGQDPESFGALAKKHGIKIIGNHHRYDFIMEKPEETMELHAMWGTANIGIAAMPVAPRKSLDELKKFISDVNKAAENYAKHGFKITYHHHNFEFMRIDGSKTIMDLLYEGFDPATISFVLDTCWVQAGCASVKEWLEKLAGRVDILHLKDVMLQDDGNHFYGTMTEIGKGLVDWKSVIELAGQTGVKHYVVEQDDNFADGNPFNSIKTSADYLKKFM